jgi:acetyltransferase-like isoleucine patch superfamily enzyme
MKNPFALFDAIYLVCAVVVYVGAGALAFYCAQGLWGDSVIAKAAALALGYFLFLHFFVVVVAGLRWLIQPPLKEGEFAVGLNREYIAWGLNSVFQGLVIAAPFAQQIFFIFYLNRLYYRFMGMQLPDSALIGTNAVIRQPELIELGERVVIGIGGKLSAHLSPDRKSHWQARIRIGDDTLIGAESIISLGVTLGKNNIIGLGTRVFPRVTTGNNVKVGPGCFLNIGAQIPDNVTIKANSIISSDMVIRPGEVWAGAPAVCIHSPLATSVENSNHEQS